MCVCVCVCVCVFLHAVITKHKQQRASLLLLLAVCACVSAWMATSPPLPPTNANYSSHEVKRSAEGEETSASGANESYKVFRQLKVYVGFYVSRLHLMERSQTTAALLD